MNTNIVHMIWIGDELSLMSQLSIKLWQRQNMIPYLWSYSNNIKNIPKGVVLKDASEIMAKESLFTFQGYGVGLFNGGKGSYSHWSDIFQLKLLKKYGGWYSQLDVACLKMPEETEYYFANHSDPNIVNTFIMKTPPDAPFIQDCIFEYENKINIQTADKIAWLDGMKIIGSHIRKNQLSSFVSSNTTECGCDKYTQTNHMPGTNIEFIHWCNALCGDPKAPTSKYHKESVYYKLLQQENLI